MRNQVVSLERKKYLRKIKLNKYAILFTQIGLIILFIAVWEILADLNIIDSFITSQPSRIVKTFANLSSNDLIRHLGITFYETVVRIFIWYFTRLFDCYCFVVI